MEALLHPELGEHRAIPFWRNPSVWFQEKKLGREFWIFFTAAFFFDAGFAVYFFLFNLYLLDFHFNERAIGLVNGALTAGSLVGTLPMGWLAKRVGVCPLLAVCFVTAPLAGVLRVVWMREPAQIGLAFLAGLAMCSWGVCFLPAVARLTTEANRASAFSLIFSVSIGTSALGEAVCGYLPQWLGAAGFAIGSAEVKRLILLASCGIALAGIVPALRLRLPPPALEREEPTEKTGSWSRHWKLHPFLWRFLPAMALWSAVLAAFNPFANVYFSRDLHIPLTRIGLIFSTAQVVQLCAGLLTPVIFRALGLVNGIVAMQMAAAITLASLAGTRSTTLAVALYLSFSVAQWMSSPGLYNLLMTETPDSQRSTAAAKTLFCNGLAGAVATTATGDLFTRFGYSPVFLGVAILALAAAIMFRFAVAPHNRKSPARP